MEFSSAITEAKKQLRLAKRNHRKNIASLKEQLTKAQAAEKKAEESYQNAYDEKLLLAKFESASLYHDRIEGENWKIPLTENIFASTRIGGELIQGGNTSRLENVRTVFITITSPKQQVTVQKKSSKPRPKKQQTK